MLPRQAEEVQAGDIGDAAAVAGPAIAIQHRTVDPGVVRSIPGGPDHGVELLLAAVGECDVPARGFDDARHQRDAIPPLELARA
jgi:hypothetical protein